MMGLYFIIFTFAIAILSTFIPLSSSQAFSDDHIDLDLRLGLPSSSNLNTESTNIPDHISTLPHNSVDDVHMIGKEQNKKRKAFDTPKKSSRKKVKQLTPEELEMERTKNRLRARKRRQDVKNRGAKAIEEAKKKKDVYTQNWKARLIQDPARLQHHREVRRIAEKKRYIAKTSNEATAEEFRRRHNELSKANYKKHKERQQLRIIGAKE